MIPVSPGAGRARGPALLFGILFILGEPGCGLFQRAVPGTEAGIEMVRIGGGAFDMGDLLEGENEDACPCTASRWHPST
jgi:hypothetical protein